MPLPGFSGVHTGLPGSWPTNWPGLSLIHMLQAQPPVQLVMPTPVNMQPIQPIQPEQPLSAITSRVNELSNIRQSMVPTTASLSGMWTSHSPGPVGTGTPAEPWQYDGKRQKLHRGRESEYLGEAQAKLLDVLTKHPGQPVSANDLAIHLGFSADVAGRSSVYKCVTRLLRRFGDDLIHQSKSGYVFGAEPMEGLGEPSAPELRTGGQGNMSPDLSNGSCTRDGRLLYDDSRATYVLDGTPISVGDVQGDLLEVLMIHHDQPLSVADMARELNMPFDKKFKNSVKRSLALLRGRFGMNIIEVDQSSGGYLIGKVKPRSPCGPTVLGKRRERNVEVPQPPGQRSRQEPVVPATLAQPVLPVMQVPVHPDSSSSSSSSSSSQAGGAPSQKDWDDLSSELPDVS